MALFRYHIEEHCEADSRFCAAAQKTISDPEPIDEMGCAGSKAVDHSEAGKQPVFVREGDEAVPQLAPEKLKLVKEMFKEWDIEGNGMIEIKALKGVTVNVGPQESQVLSQLIAMDYNGDGFVEASVRAAVPHARRAPALVRCPPCGRIFDSALLLSAFRCPVSVTWGCLSLAPRSPDCSVLC